MNELIFKKATPKSGAHEAFLTTESNKKTSGPLSKHFRSRDDLFELNNILFENKFITKERKEYLENLIKNMVLNKDATRMPKEEFEKEVKFLVGILKILKKENSSILDMFIWKRKD